MRIQCYYTKKNCGFRWFLFLFNTKFFFWFFWYSLFLEIPRDFNVLLPNADETLTVKCLSINHIIQLEIRCRQLFELHSVDVLWPNWLKLSRIIIKLFRNNHKYGLSVVHHWIINGKSLTACIDAMRQVKAFFSPFWLLFLCVICLGFVDKLLLIYYDNVTYGHIIHPLQPSTSISHGFAHHINKLW